MIQRILRFLGIHKKKELRSYVLHKDVPTAVVYRCISCGKTFLGARPSLADRMDAMLARNDELAKEMQRYMERHPKEKARYEQAMKDLERGEGMNTRTCACGAEMKEVHTCLDGTGVFWWCPECERRED